jgi:hypothetical protein
MTPEEKIRVRDLPKLIVNENDFAKMKVLAIELERLLAKELSSLEKYRELRSKPISRRSTGEFRPEDQHN